MGWFKKSSDETEPARKINEIIANNYNNYEGEYIKPLKKIHSLLRKEIGDKKFLAFLEEQERDNPRPVYKP